MSLYLQQSLHDSPLIAGLVIAPQGLVGFVTGMYGSRLLRRLQLRRLLIASTFATGLGFLALVDLPSHGHYGADLLAVLVIGFGTVGTIFGTTVMAAQGMADADQGVVGGVINTTRQVGAGTSTIDGDRKAMLLAAFFGLVGTLIAWFGTRTSSSGASVHDIGRHPASRDEVAQQGEAHELRHIG
jgi:predicted MFS family arabinose efflux permease